jgi:hypothetical protein
MQAIVQTTKPRAKSRRVETPAAEPTVPVFARRTMPTPVKAPKVAAAVSGHAAQQSPAAGRPFWQTEPCPSWCTLKDAVQLGHTGHSDSDSYDDRNHWACEPDEGVDLSLLDPRRVAGVSAEKTANGVAQPAAYGPHSMSVSLQQHYRDAAPHILIEAPLVDAFGRVQKGSTGVRMTLAEAREMRERITRLLDQVAGAQTAAPVGHAAWCTEHSDVAGACYGAEVEFVVADMSVGSGGRTTVRVQTSQAGDEAPTVNVARGREDVLALDADGAEKLAQTLLAQAAAIRAQESK